MLTRRWMALSAVVVMVGVSACADDSSTADLERSAPTSTTDLERSASASTADTVASTPAVFEWVDCDWFTPDGMNAVIALAQATAGTDFAFERFEDETMCVATREGPSNGLDEWIRGATWYTSRSNDWVLPEGAISLRIETTDLPLDDEAWERLGYRAHPMLDESVHYQFPKHTNPAIPYGSGESVAANLLIGGRPLVVFSLRIGDAEVREGPSPKYETVAFAIANELLREMGWIG